MTIPKQEERFDYKGFPCVILFMPMGYRCGYVGIPFEQKKTVTEKIVCHGGITYTDEHLYHQNDVNTLWIGFDCGHYFDGYDVEKIKELYRDDEESMKWISIISENMKRYNGKFPFRTLKYCEEQCKQIVEQVIKLGVKAEVSK